MAPAPTATVVFALNLCLHLPCLPLVACKKRILRRHVFSRLALRIALSSAFISVVSNVITAYDPERSPPLVLLPLQLGAMLVVEDICIKWSSRALSSRMAGSWRPGSLCCALPFSLFAPLECATVLDWISAFCGATGAVRLVQPCFSVVCCWVVLRHLESCVSAGLIHRTSGAGTHASAYDRIAIALLELSERIVGWVQAVHGEPDLALPLSALLPRILALGTGAHSLGRDQPWVIQLRYALLLNAFAMVFERNRLFAYDAVAASLLLLALPAEWLAWCAQHIEQQT